MTTTHTLSGEFNLPSGAPARGRIRIEVGGLDPDSGAWVDVIEVRDPAGDLVWTGPQEIALAAGRIVNESGDPLRLPAPDPDLVPAEWSYRVTAKLDHLSSADQPVKVFTLTGPVDWADLSAGPAVALAAAVYVTPADLAVMEAQLAQLSEWVGSPRGAIDHGEVSGVLALPATYGVQELTAVGDVLLDPTGPVGVSVAVRIRQDALGGHAVVFAPEVTTSGAWSIPTTPAAEMVVTLVRWVSGWCAYPAAQTAGAGGGGGGGGDPIEVAAQAPVFDDSALTITIPAVAGVVYSLDGNAAASGDYPADAGTTYTVTAEAEAGYVLTVGLPDTWTHDFPAAEAWVQAFADTLLAPVGEITVRAGWAVTNANAGYDHVTTDATSTYATGLGAMRVENTPALKHALECDYDLSDGDTYSEVNFTVSASWGSHKIRVGRANAGAAHATISALSTAGWADFAAEPGVDLAAQPLAGHARVECDGVRIYVYLNGVLIAGGLRDAANNPSWAGAATGSSLAFSGTPNTARKTRVKNVKLETKA